MLPNSESPAAQPHNKHLLEIASLSLRLGFTAFGGPAAHIAMLHDEVVTRKKWLSDDRYLELLGATNLIPGPNSTEMFIHIGYVRGGILGLIVSGVCFIAPAMLMVLLLSWLYVQFNATPGFQSILYGIKPVIIAIILQALWNLGKKAITTWQAILLAVILLGLYIAGINEILLLLIGGAAYILLERVSRSWGTIKTSLIFLLGSTWIWSANQNVPVTLSSIFLSFVKIGSVLYGSGYVLLAFLHSEFVIQNGWLTEQQLIDAVAIGQLTPGPVFTTATFIGYVLAGLPGALVATAGIFLPAFFFVAISIPLLPRIRKSPLLSHFLDGVIIASLALMTAVTWELGQAALVDLTTIVLGVISGILLFRYRINTTWLILLGVVVGLVHGYLT